VKLLFNSQSSHIEKKIGSLSTQLSTQLDGGLSSRAGYAMKIM